MTLSTPRMFLVFKGAWLEVDASLATRRGGIRALAREAEGKWNVQPNLYEFQHDATGKVDSSPTLQNAMEGTPNGVCRLEVIERPEGAMMRTMQTQMQRLEERVMAKVEAMVADVRKESEWSSSRISSCMAPIVQCIATEQIELRNKVACIAPMVQCLAMEQIEQRNTVGDISPVVQCIGTQHMELRSKVAEISKEVDVLVAQTANTATTSNIEEKNVELLEHELQQECAMQAACDLDLCSADNLEELRDEICNLDQKRACQIDCASPTKIVSKSGRRKSLDSNHKLGVHDASVDWSTHSIAGFSYSGKIAKGMPSTSLFESKCHPGDKWSVQLGDAPFAQSVMGSQLSLSKSAFGHRSCPLLPPLY